MSQVGHKGAAGRVPTSPATAVSLLLCCTQWDDRQNSQITLYTDGNQYGGMEVQTVVCQISVIRQRQLSHFSPIS